MTERVEAGQITDREALEARIELMASGERAYYDLTSSLVSDWQQRPRFSNDKPLQYGPVRVTLANLVPWTERGTDGNETNHSALKYVSLQSDLNAPPGEETRWECSFQFYENGPGIIRAEETTRILPDPNDPDPAKGTKSWTSMSIQNVERPISPEELDVLNTFLNNLTPVKRS